MNRWTLLTCSLFVILFLGCDDGGGGDEEPMSGNPVSTAMNTAPPTPNPVPEPGPVAVQDAFEATGNARLTVAPDQGVLSNDTLNGAVVFGFQANGAQGGSFDLNADGSFVYTPAPGFRGTETFNYTLRNSAALAVATVTITVDQLAFFVDNTAADGGDGTLASPFNEFNRAIAAGPLPGDTIFIFRGDGTERGLVRPRLPDGVNLTGELAGLPGVVPPGEPPLIRDSLQILNGNSVSGIRFIQAGIGGNEASNVTILNNEFIGGAAISFNGLASGTLVIRGNYIEGRNGITPVNVQAHLSSEVTCSIEDNTFPEGTQFARSAFRVLATGNARLNLSLSNNVINPATFDGLLDLHLANAATAEIAVKGNTLPGTVAFGSGGDAVDISLSGTSKLTGSLEDNKLGILEGDGIVVVLDNESEAELSIERNEMAPGTRDMRVGIDLRARLTSHGVFRLIGNQITDRMGVEDSIRLGCFNASTMRVLMQDNVTTGLMSGLRYFGGSDVCLDMTNNVIPGLRIDEPGLRLERFSAAHGGPIDSVNTIGSITGGANVASVPVGTCGF